MHIDPVKALFWAAILNGLVAAPLMAVIMIMASSKKVMAQFIIPLHLRAMGWLATAVMICAWYWCVCYVEVSCSRQTARVWCQRGTDLDRPRRGNTTNYAYDADGPWTKTTYADNSFTQANYDAAGRVGSTVDAKNNTTTYGYDDAAGERRSPTRSTTPLASL